MATIIVLLDKQEGHTLANFLLLRKLKARGHQIYCLGLSQVKGWVRDQGFEFIPIMDDVLKREAIRNPDEEDARNQYFGYLVRGELLDDVIVRLKPDLAIIHSHYNIEGLVIHYRYHLPLVFFMPSFRVVSREKACESAIYNLLDLKSGAAELLELLRQSRVQFRNLREVARLILQFPELMLLPEAFDLPGRGADPEVYYLGDGIDLERSEDTFQWEGIDGGRPLIYIALGSQSRFAEEWSRRLFRAAVETAKTRPDWQFVMAVGKTFDVGEFMPATDNVRLVNWAPQLEILSRADLMVNHGGYGSIKECILMGVPILVFPLLLGNDHFDCAEQVTHHGLGLRGDIDSVSSSELSHLIRQVIENQSFKSRVEAMREKFKQQNRLDIGVKIIEDLITNGARARRSGGRLPRGI